MKNKKKTTVNVSALVIRHDKLDKKQKKSC